jgi:hypothetical protein
LLIWSGRRLINLRSAVSRKSQAQPVRKALLENPEAPVYKGRVVIKAQQGQ